MSELAVIEQYNTGIVSIINDGAAMNNLRNIANDLASAKMSVPKHLQGQPADCMAVAMQAYQWGMNPFAVAQKTHFVNGAIGYEAQLVNAVIQASGAIVGRFHYEYSGDGQALACRVGAIPRYETEVVWGEWLRLTDVKIQNSPLWKTNPKQQLGYLQVKNWSRAYAPGAILGVYTPDELQVMPEREINPAPQATNGAPVAKTSLKARKAKQEPIEQEAVEAQQPANEPEIEAPNFGDEPQYSPEVEAMINALYDCYEPEHFTEWEAAAAAMGLAKNSTEYVAMSGAYLSRKREIKAQQGA